MIGFWPAVVYAVIKASVAIALFGMVAIGYLFGRLSLVERLVAFIASVFILGEFPYSDLLGYILAAAMVGRHWWLARNQLTERPA